METEALDPLLLLKGLFILTAIPPVGMALWFEYFWSSVEEQKKESVEFELADELQKVRLGTLSSLFLQLFLFLGSSETRKAYPLLTTLLFLTAIFTHLWQQGSMEERLSSLVKSTTKSSTQLLQGLRTLLWVIFSGGLYLTITIATVSFFAMIAQLSSFSALWKALIIATGLIVGIISGLAMSFALGPIQIRKIFPTSPLGDESIRSEIELCFKESSLKTPSLWVIESAEGQSNNVMISGFRNGKGILYPSLFISKPLLGALTPSQLRAIMLHEIAHIRLAHLTDRFALSSGLIIGATLVSGGSAVLSHLLFNHPGVSSWIGLISLMGCFIASFRMIDQQSRLHEIEADIYAIKSGALIEDLESALRKLDELNQIQYDRNLRPLRVTQSSHPLTDERILILKKYFQQHSTKPTSNEDKPESEGQTQDAA